MLEQSTSSQLSSRQNSKAPTDGVGLGAAAGLGVGLVRVGEGAAGVADLIGGPVGITAPELGHQELVIVPIVVFKRPAITYPEVQ